ncbi:hypothetical protein ACOSQ3_031493 [Xanthoceras sorbifolium]
MATHLYSRSLLSKLTPTTTKPLAFLFSRSFSSASIAPFLTKPTSASSLSLLRRLRPLAGAGASYFGRSLPDFRGLSTRATSSSLNDQNPNWSNRPPKETILLEGCDFEHWLVVMEPPPENTTRDEIIDSYIKTLAIVLGSEEEARMKIYSVSTRCYYAFGALVPEEVSLKIKELPRVRWVLPDSYLDVKNKDYGGEPFINGQAVPYDPKYHEEWIRNNSRANERNRRNDRPRSFDRSRNYERRRENMQTAPPPGGNMPPPGSNMPPPGANMPPPGRNMPPPGGNMPPNFNRMPPNMGGMPQSNMGGMPQGNYGGMPPNNNSGNNYGGMPPNNNSGNNYGGMPPNNSGGMPPNNSGGMPQNYGGMPPPNAGMTPNAGWSNNMPGNMQQNNQSANPQFQNSYGNGDMPGGNPYQG